MKLESRGRWEAVHDDGYVEHASGHDVGHGADLAADRRVAGAGDSRGDKVPALVIAMQPLVWLVGLRVYLGGVLVGSLVWEVLHLPLYTIWTAGTLREQAFAAGHCTLGDLVIAACALTRSPFSLRALPAGPRDRFWPVATLTVAFGLAYTVFSEWLNVVVRAAWTYSDLMPVVSVAGLKIGLSPLLQWIVVPSAAFAIMRRVTNQTKGGRS